MQNRVSGDIFICFGAKNDAYSWVVPFTAFQLVIHSDVHIHLPNILMSDLVGFQVDKYKTFQNIIVEYQINKIVLLFHLSLVKVSGNVSMRVMEQIFHSLRGKSPERFCRTDKSYKDLFS